MAKQKTKVARVRMTDAEVAKYLTHYFKAHDLKGPKEQGEAVRRCAATRWAALERDQKKHAGKGTKKGARKAPGKPKAKRKAA